VPRVGLCGPHVAVALGTWRLGHDCAGEQSCRIRRRWNRMACLGGSLAPRSDCTLQLAECFGLSAAKRRATWEVWSKGNEALVFDAPKNVSGITASDGHGGYLWAVLCPSRSEPTAAALACLAPPASLSLPRSWPLWARGPHAVTSASGRFAAEHHHVPVLAIEDHGSRCGSAAPFCRISIEMLSGELTKAMRPSRGGRLIVRPASPKR
jgi:hypothetical protein